MDCPANPDRSGADSPPFVGASQCAQTAEIWIIRLDASEHDVRAAVLHLTPDERIRAAAHHNEQARRRHILARAGLRQILAKRLNTDPAEIQFRAGQHGKPSIDTPPETRIEFNLSHSHDLALVAVSAVGEIGVDVEKLRPMPNAQRLADRFFTPREAAALRQLPDVNRNTAFFNLWTRKEALAKATGQGVGRTSSKYEVSWETEAVLKAAEGDDIAAARWSLLGFEPAPGYIAAVAMQTPGAHFSLHDFNPAATP